MRLTEVILMESRQLARRIEECFPGFKVNKSKRILAGWDNIVLEVNGKYIFRFPRFPVSEEHLRTDLKIVPFLNNNLSVAVPKYQFVWRGSKKQPGWFAGYPKIPGEPLTVGAFRRAWVENLAESITRFLRELHNLDTSAKELAILPRRAPKGNVDSLKKTYSRVRRAVYPLLDHGTTRHIDKFFATLLEDFDKSNFDATFVHGDLTSGNILLEPASGTVTGILDWADAVIGDPALDFAGLFEVNKTLGEEVLRRLKGIDTNFRNRVDWYVRMIPFYEILWGVDIGSEKFRTTGLKRLRRRLETRYVQVDNSSGRTFY